MPYYCNNRTLAVKDLQNYPKNSNQKFLNTDRTWQWQLQSLLFYVVIFYVYHNEHTPIGHAQITSLYPRHLWLLTQRDIINGR